MKEISYNRHASQCIFAGSNVMNYSKLNKRVEQDEIQIGDIAQLSFDGNVFGYTLYSFNKRIY